MDSKETRRVFIKKLGYSVAISSIYLAGADRLMASNVKTLHGIHKKFILQPAKERVWLGEDFWAIPLEDWSLKSGKIVFSGSMQNARVNMITTHINEGKGAFKISTSLGVEAYGAKNTGSAGLSLGVKDNFDDDVKAACYYGNGFNIAISTAGFLVVGNQKMALPKGFNYDDIELECTVKRGSTTTKIKAVAKSASLKAVNQVEIEEDLSGYFALINNIDNTNGAKFWFKDIQFEGDKLIDKPDQAFGPILWPMYTLHNNIMKMSVQMPPLAADDEKELVLSTKLGEEWQEQQRVYIDSNSFQGVFKINNWKKEHDTPYRITYENEGKTYTYDGVVKKEPVSKQLRLAGLTCQQWQAYPYSPLVKNLEKYEPDMLFFSGDQVYEENGGYFIKREPIEASVLSYLGKWFMFGWAFGKIMRNRPTICTPDDHDVFHGNLWGEGGKLIPVDDWTVKKYRDAHGGYVQSPEMINIVHKTNCAHMPDCPDADTLPSGITTWYTELIYGGVSFAIISDRMFKSGPEEVRGEGGGRIDHIRSPLKPDELEKQDLQFLGSRQMDFLNKWISDWSGSSMKVLLSQTLFSNVGTHHGNDKMFLYGDMDSGGWPKKQRDEVIKILRKGYAFHINGDQHLPFIVQYSVDEKQDGGWTFCTPAISTGYIRWGQPDLVDMPFINRPSHNLPNTGCYRDIFGNDNFVYAVGNPIDDWQNENRYIQAQNKASGFGLITFDLHKRDIKMDAYRFLSDKDKPSDEDQYPGWPLTIKQTDNDGRKFNYSLPTLKFNQENQLVKVFTGKKELLNVIRVNGVSHQFFVPDTNQYYLEVGEADKIKKIEGLKGIRNNTQTLELEV